MCCCSHLICTCTILLQRSGADLQIESFVGRTDITAAALGDQHSLFLDSQGVVWSCGENKEGQCGLGTPLEVLAAQHRKAYHQAMRASLEGLTFQV